MSATPLPAWCAAEAERAVVSRHLRPVPGVPGTRLGVVSWPPSPAHALTVRWHFWWQAHLLDCAVDAWCREPTQVRQDRIRRLVRGIRVRNLGRFTNAYYDDIAWMGLALRRSAAATGRAEPAVRGIATRLLDAWSPPSGGIPWRVGDRFFNAPANGPAAILLARCGFSTRARQMDDWMNDRLRVAGSDLIADGLVPGEPVQPVYYSYCQGVVLGAEVELARLGGSRTRIHRLVAAVDREMTVGGVLRGHGGGNGGLFTGILARYLALVATDLPGGGPEDQEARATAARLVLASAAGAWAQARKTPTGPVFGPDWSLPAELPRRGPVGRTVGARVDQSAQPERDLSVQLSGWMLLEAAARLA